jgi:hypothetical protein
MALFLPTGPTHWNSFSRSGVRSDRGRGAEVDVQEPAQAQRDLDRALGVGQVDDDHEVDFAERRVTRLELAAMLLDQGQRVFGALGADRISGRWRRPAEHQIGRHETSPSQSAKTF